MESTQTLLGSERIARDGLVATSRWCAIQDTQTTFTALRRKDGGVQGASCTLELKKRMRWKIEDECPDYEAQVFGFDATETLRAKRFSEQYPKAKPVYPLMDRGLSKSECLAIIERAGIVLPEMYRLGYHNNNCVGCVKGGIGYWNKIRQDFPDAFSRMASIERLRGFASHKERDGTPIYLDELDPNRGHHQSEIIPECGLFCDLEAMDII